jgi:hypothetical protein
MPEGPSNNRSNQNNNLFQYPLKGNSSSNPAYENSRNKAKGCQLLVSSEKDACGLRIFHFNLLFFKKFIIIES